MRKKRNLHQQKSKRLKSVKKRACFPRTPNRRMRKQALVACVWSRLPAPRDRRLVLVHESQRGETSAIPGSENLFAFQKFC